MLRLLLIGQRRGTGFTCSMPCRCSNIATLCETTVNIRCPPSPAARLARAARPLVNRPGASFCLGSLGAERARPRLRAPFAARAPHRPSGTPCLIPCTHLHLSCASSRVTCTPGTLGAPKSHLFGNSSARRLGAILTSSIARDKEKPRQRERTSHELLRRTWTHLLRRGKRP